MVVAVLALVLVRGTGNFWPAQVTKFAYQEEGKH